MRKIKTLCRNLADDKQEEEMKPRRFSMFDFKREKKVVFTINALFQNEYTVISRF
jgi:hypothetical protein